MDNMRISLRPVADPIVPMQFIAIVSKNIIF